MLSINLTVWRKKLADKKTESTTPSGSAVCTHVSHTQAQTGQDRAQHNTTPVYSHPWSSRGTTPGTSPGLVAGVLLGLRG